MAKQQKRDFEKEVKETNRLTVSEKERLALLQKRNELLSKI